MFFFFIIFGRFPLKPAVCAGASECSTDHRIKRRMVVTEMASTRVRKTAQMPIVKVELKVFACLIRFSGEWSQGYPYIHRLQPDCIGSSRYQAPTPASTDVRPTPETAGKYSIRCVVLKELKIMLQPARSWCQRSKPMTTKGLFLSLF